MPPPETFSFTPPLRPPFVSYEQWLSKTSQRFKARSSDTRAVDLAYQRCVSGPNRGPAAERALLTALDQFLTTKGGHWHLVARNQASDGLMQRLHDHLRQQHGAADHREAGLRRVLSHDVPESRFGVLYLLGHARIDLNHLSLALEGLASTGNVVGQAMGPQFSTTVAGHALGGSHISTLGAATARLGAGAARTGLLAGSQVQRDLVTPSSLTLPRLAWPQDRQALLAMDPTGLVAGFAALGPVMMQISQTVLRAVQDFLGWFLRKLRANERLVLQVAGTLVKLVVANILQNAVPYLSSAIDIGQGVVKTLQASKTSIETWLMRRQVNLMSGHPEQIGAAIESQMQQGIGTGLWSALKGGAGVATQVFLPGMGALVGAIISGVEFIVVTIKRLCEQSDIHDFLDQARTLWTEQQRFATRNEHGHLRPDLTPRSGSLIHDTEGFKAFFQQGCDASPLIPMLTLNSGICGSLWTMIKLSDDTLSPKMIEPATFSAGDSYFTRLKQFGQRYMAASGFRVHSANADVQRLLTHATRDHTATLSHTDRVLALAGGL
ncbi:hypothetical protein C7444_10492 [Sphaerotilus hippei]|uniref:Uncharacterized protein n=1 Tax=Sphaerotilus hippei TaxID=744406 RepID=A0A318H2D2_9BURK|nr:hypothetical protein [Sphaerotilus hippei]PXW97490.1 hypothetical protein C7444_10492 [Sphaerotilus hippei]